MKNTIAFIAGLLIFIYWIPLQSYGQHYADTTTLPQIKITSLNGYGPYIISGQRSNLFVLYHLPTNTHEVIMKMIDQKGELIDEAYTETGNNLSIASWSFEADTMGFPLSPQLHIELHYQTDSIAIYQFPYTVYPDTLVTKAAQGWGPFTTNNYTFSDTLWQPVPELENRFSVSNLPPRTDTIEFRIYDTDSAVISSHLVTTNPGTYLDSAVYENVRMDNLPTNTDFLDIIIHCEGGPKNGLHYPKNLIVLPHSPILKFESLEQNLIDSIPSFYENQISGQALALDSTMYALIQNGPGQMDGDIYPGPYSIDPLKSSYSMEAWIKFDFDQFTSTYEVMDILSVDSVFSFYFGGSQTGNCLLGISSESNVTWRELWTVTFPHSLFYGEAWHHVAFVCSYPEEGYPTGKFYFDGNLLPGTEFDQFNYDNILQYSNLYYLLRKNQPLIIGNKYGGHDFLIDAIDEVRMWSKALSHQEILLHNRQSPMQQPDLVGYWNFDDLRNRLNIISDKSYNNNMGILKNGAYFLPQHPAVQLVIDTLKVLSSSIETDSVTYQFIGGANQIIDQQTKISHNGISKLSYDIAALPYTINKLKVIEHFNPNKPEGLETEYKLHGLAPEPIATPQYNWNTYFSTPDHMAKTYAPVTVSNFPDYTKKVTLGLKKGDLLYDTVSYTETSIPFHHSLSLNGSNNYIETTQQIEAPEEFTIMFWMKTTSSAGGKLVSFSDKKNGTNVTQHDRDLYIEADGTLRFKIQSTDKDITLYGLNINNDGVWHHIAVSAGNNTSTLLYVDGSMLDDEYISDPVNFDGYWIFGKNCTSKGDEPENIAEYFQGTLSEISIFNRALDYDEINALRFKSEIQQDQSLYYKLNEGTGHAIFDFAGTNIATVKGSTPVWTLTKDLLFVNWNKKVQNHDPGTYTLFAKVVYPEAPQGGAEYLLGNFLVKDPYPGTTFNFGLTLGQGYFSEGIALINELSIHSDTSYVGNAFWDSDFIGYKFFTADHELIGENYQYYTTTPADALFTIDMGDAPQGSYLSIESGYREDNSEMNTFHSAAIPIYIHPLIPPKVKCNPGPFTQAIAPGTMQHNNTFTITMEPFTDLNKILLVFTDKDNNQIGTTEAEKVTDTLWTATYDMAQLSPPVSYLKYEYYLGTNPHPAAIEGPTSISIQRTRPRWFDFVADTDFTDVQESGDQVTFNVSTPFQKDWLINNYVGVEIPDYVPMVGGMQSKMESPKVKAALAYYISDNSLQLTGDPEFYQSYIPLGFGSTDLIRLSYNNSQNNSYYLDADNNLVIIQNHFEGGGVVTDFLVFDDVVERIASIFDKVESVEPLANIIKPTFSFSASVQFEYACRQRMIMDTIYGKWGSYGDLHIDANPEHTEAYEKSASYHFYSGAFGVEFSIGAELLDGLLSGNFGIDGRVALGYGHSYITIPSTDTRPLKSAAFQIYGRFYIDALWGWYEKNVWGPKMFYSHNFWGDDLSECFPPIDGKDLFENPLETYDYQDLTTKVSPVSWFTKMNQPVPYPAIAQSSDKTVFTWIERGTEYGQRSTKISYLKNDVQKFSAPEIIEINNHALHNPVSESIDENLLLLTWSQSRHDAKSFRNLKTDTPLGAFASSLDIWFAIYDMEANTTLQIQAIEDDFSGKATGRAEANPKIAVISETLAIISWQVSDLQNDEAAIWYITLEKQANTWTASEPQIIFQSPEAKAQIQLSAITEGKAMLTWIQLSEEPATDKKLMYSLYNENTWSTPAEMLDFAETEYPNFYDMEFKNEKGLIVISSYENENNRLPYEKLTRLDWDNNSVSWDEKSKALLLIDSLHHLQYPTIAINNAGIATIAFKAEKIAQKDTLSAISRIDILSGPLSETPALWSYIPGSAYVCDTNNQLKDIALSYLNQDTLMLLSNEFPMAATNTRFQPLNGVMFGDPYMNLVLRSFAIDENGNIEDVDENGYFVGIDEPISNADENNGIRCYPNPCRELTMISFDVEDLSLVKLELFDINGKHITSLINKEFSAGTYQLELNTSLLPPGIYNGVLTQNQQTSSIKIIVNR